MAHADRFDACTTRAVKTLRILSIRNHHGERRDETPLGNRVDERLQVAAATRDENANSTAGEGQAAHCS
jgi:hypothetical protein